MCVPIGGRHFGSRPALDALKDALRTFCAAPALMPKYAVSELYHLPQLYTVISTLTWAVFETFGLIV